MSINGSSKRRFPHFGMMLFATVVLLVVAGAISIWLPYHREQVAIAEIKSVTQLITRLPGYKPEIRKGGPTWLRERIGDGHMEVFDRVIGVDLTGADIDDGFVVEYLAPFELENLSLATPHITDAGLAHLRKWPKLKSLVLDDTQITDDGLKHVTGLTELRVLALNRTRIGDAGLAHLAGMPSLIALSLPDTQVTDAGLASIRGMTSLEILDLCNTRVTDAGLAHLTGMNKLWVLQLQHTEITDAGLIHLSGLSQLKNLDLRRTRVTQAGVDNLQTHLPSCNIDFEPE